MKLLGPKLLINETVRYFFCPWNDLKKNNRQKNDLKNVWEPLLQSAYFQLPLGPVCLDGSLGSPCLEVSLSLKAQTDTDAHSFKWDHGLKIQVPPKARNVIIHTYHNYWPS